MKPALLLFPNLLGKDRNHEAYFPKSVDQAVETIDGLIAESETAGRRFLGRFQTKKDPREIPIALYNEHTKDDDIDFLLEPLKNGERWGFVSDAGLPCIADPGSKLVFRARQIGIKVQAYVGPSSLLLGLMLSGLSGQSFTFHGYLEKDAERLKARLKELEAEAKKTGYTQIFMERPYKNKQTMAALMDVLGAETLLSVAWELTTPDQGVLTQTVENWNKSPLPNLEKKNAIFLIGR